MKLQTMSQQYLVFLNLLSHEFWYSTTFFLVNSSSSSLSFKIHTVPEPFNLDLHFSYTEFHPLTSIYLFQYDKEKPARPMRCRDSCDEQWSCQLCTVNSQRQPNTKQNKNQTHTTFLRSSLPTSNLTNLNILNLISVSNVVSLIWQL